jgi:pyruvate,water dikinase
LGRLGDIFEAVGFPRELLEILILSEQEDKKPKIKITLKSLKHFPRLIKFMISKLFLFERKIKRDLEILIKKYDQFNEEDIIDKDPNEIIESINNLFVLNKQVVYFNLIIPLFNYFFNNRLVRRLKKYNYTLEMLDNQLKYQQSLTDFEPNTHIERLSRVFRSLPEAKQNEIRKSSYNNFLKIPSIVEFKTDVIDFIEKFGHLSDSGNDFSTLTWKDEPKKVLEMITSYNNSKIKLEATDYLPLKKIRMKSLLGKVKRYRYYKEKISFEYSYGYNLFRKYFSVLGMQFVEKGIIHSVDDIYYLKFNEITEIIEDELWKTDKKDKIRKIKSEIQQYYNIAVPATIYGEVIPPINLETRVYNKFVGKASSAGYYIGKIRKIRGIKEFDKVKEGDVLVIPYSDVAWTPIILKAGAVLSESGGILSHCSIVAREYSIPAVVSVEGIQTLNDGDTVSVDGYKGVILLVERVSKNS